MKKISPIIIGIDSSTTCTGYAVMKKDKKEYKLIKYGKVIPPKEIGYLRTCEYIYNELEKVISGCDQEVVVILEQPNSFRNGDTTRKLCGLYEIIRFMVMLRFGIEPLEANTKTVKKVVCENGNADKKEMVETINRLYNLNLVFSTSQNKEKTDDDIADAVGITTYYARTFG